jgi:hypothetical protein
MSFHKNDNLYFMKHLWLVCRLIYSQDIIQSWNIFSSIIAASGTISNQILRDTQGCGEYLWISICQIY